MAFRTSIRIRFGDEDHAGIVYFPRFFDFFHVAFEDFFDHQGMPYKDVLDVQHVGFPMAHIESDFRRPLRFGDIFEVDVWVHRIGRTSVTFHYRGRKRGEDQDAALAQMTAVCIDMRTFQPIPVPENILALLERHRDAPADYVPMQKRGSP